MSKPILLYRKMDDADRAYMVKSGKVTCKITENDTFELPCENVIVGGGEILVEKEQMFPEARHMTLSYIPANKKPIKTQIIKLSVNQLLDSVSTYKVAFHTARFIASCLTKINDIRTNKNNQLNRAEGLLKTYSIIYAKAVEKLRKPFEELGFPWIDKLMTESSDTIIYEKGKAFVSLENRKRVELDSDKLDKFNVRYPKGSFICKQGDEGNELFKLVEGKLKVIVDGNDVTDIKEGSVFGEMALLLGETRTATLKAMEDSIITVISKDQLPKVVKEDKDFFKNIIITLSRWELISINLVENLQDLIKESKEAVDEHVSKKKLIEYKQMIKELRKKINELFAKYEQQFLFHISNEITEDLKKIENKKV